MSEQNAIPTGPFNGPVECGIRAMVLLAVAAPDGCDLRRLVIYDYLLVHSADVPDEVLTKLVSAGERPESLHPATPYRAGELLVRRQTLVAGLRLLMGKGLVAPRFDDRGITYTATELSRPFLGILESEYLRDLRVRGEWVVRVFSQLPDEELSAFANQHLRDWGGEFVNQSLLRRSGA